MAAEWRIFFFKKTLILAFEVIAQPSILIKLHYFSIFRALCPLFFPDLLTKSLWKTRVDRRNIVVCALLISWSRSEKNIIIWQDNARSLCHFEKKISCNFNNISQSDNSCDMSLIFFFGTDFKLVRFLNQCVEMYV